MNEDDLARRLIAIVRTERKASRESVRELHERALDERIADGEAIGGLVFDGRDGNLVTLRCGDNGSRFREGDPIWLSDGDPRSSSACAARIVDIDPVAARIVVELESRRPDDFDPRMSSVLDRRDLDFGDREAEAVRSVFSRRPQFAAARELLTGRGVRTAATPVATRADAAREGLDDTQTAAFLAATGGSFELVQGPPGAGKTKLAAAVIRAFCRAGKSVCVAAFTHRAVNNVLVRVAAELEADESLPIVKIERGAARELAGLRNVTVCASARASGGVIPKLGPCVVGVTTHSAAGLLERRFDLVLVDEAGQVSLPHGAAALALASRHVLVGDHRQLPPLVVGEHQDPLAGVSLFEHLHGIYGSQLLTTTYRMNTVLCELPSAAFYGGALVAGAANRARRLATRDSTDSWFAPEPEAIVIPLAHRGARVLAPSEAAIAAELVVRAAEAGVDLDEIAVIAPHRAQGNRIRALLRQGPLGAGGKPLPLVDTVERLQGGERDVIILSLTASDPEAMHRDADFFFSPNRLNVALTRARKKLFVLMSDALLEAWPDGWRALRGAEILRRIYREWPHRPAPPVR